MTEDQIFVEGKIKPGGNEIYINGTQLDPGPSLALANHSPTGFNWGFGGSGPAQTALAILLYCTDQETALNYYQAFKWQFVGAWPFNKDFSCAINIPGWIQAQKAYSQQRYNFFDLQLDDNNQIIGVEDQNE